MSERVDTNDSYDAIVIGAGIAGETCARRLSVAGMRVALLERDLIGGECAFWARIPSETLFGPANEVWRAQQIAGIHSPALAGPSEHLSGQEGVGHIHLPERNDSLEAEALQKIGIDLIRGDARVLNPGRVRIGERVLDTSRLVLATGTLAHPPKVAGLSDSGYWTNREALSYKALPQHVLVVGGEAQAVELAQMFRLYGSEVTLVTHANRLIAHEDPEVGDLVQEQLRRRGIRVLVGRALCQVSRDPDGNYAVTLAPDATLHAQALIMAGSRMARTDVLAEFARSSLQVTDQGIQVDQFCRAADGIWAIGDVTGMVPLSHFARYQAEIAADDMLGQSHPARYMSVPRLYFTEPPIAATGLTLEQATKKGLAVSSVTVELNAPSPHLSAREEHGHLVLHADRRRGVLVGAWAIAHDAGEWIQLAGLAISAGTPVAVLHDTVEQYPGFTEPYRLALAQLISQVDS
jgi:pyruvate/2-oxoglutarate dehydrogenase complex dihydrolipoamide dehydrogenase (E3) component